MAPIPTALDVWLARRRLAGRLLPTPLRPSPALTAECGGDIRLKLESVNPTHSFKIRGALNALLALSETVSSPEPPVAPAEVVAASAGNHGLAIATAARTLGLRALVYTPASAPNAKTAAISAQGAVLDTSGADYDAAERLAMAESSRRGVPFISPYNHRDVIAGAGTIGLEIVDAWPSVDTVVLPIGGGGLASGVGLALKAAAPRARLVAVEVDASTPFTVGLAKGRITPIAPQPTMADGLAGNLESGSITFPLVQQVVDEVVTVTEDQLVDALRALARHDHLMVEGSAAVAVAAVMSGKVPTRDRSTAVVITGANIDLERFVGAIQ